MIAKDVEHKHHDVFQPFVGLYIQGDYQFCLTTIPQQGAVANDTTREGDELIIKAITVRLNLRNNINGALSGDTNDSTLWRIMIVQDKSHNTTGLINFSSVLNQAGGSYNTASLRNVDRQGDMIVLYDKIHKTEYLKDLNKFQIIKVNLKYMKKKLEFSNALGTSNTGGIYLLAMCDSANLIADPDFSYSSRVIFTDS
jgi:hypothetical protein